MINMLLSHIATLQLAGLTMEGVGHGVRWARFKADTVASNSSKRARLGSLSCFFEILKTSFRIVFNGHEPVEEFSF
jgi:hypothetical protein